MTRRWLTAAVAGLTLLVGAGPLAAQGKVQKVSKKLVERAEDTLKSIQESEKQLQKVAERYGKLVGGKNVKTRRNEHGNVRDELKSVSSLRSQDAGHRLHHRAQRDQAHPRSHPQTRHSLSISPTHPARRGSHRLRAGSAVVSARARGELSAEGRSEVQVLRALVPERGLGSLNYGRPSEEHGVPKAVRIDVRSGRSFDGDRPEPSAWGRVRRATS
jgi:hypothetical protein